MESTSGNELNHERHSLEESFVQPYDDLDGTGIHLASLAEKKRLWWRNAFINTIFIASWCVLLLRIQSEKGFYLTSGFSSPCSCQYTINGCSLPNTSDFLHHYS